VDRGGSERNPDREGADMDEKQQDQVRSACCYCGSEVQARIKKCPHCGEWIRWTLRQTLEIAGRVVLLASFLLALWELRQSRELQEIQAVNNVMSRYIEMDRLLLEMPEFVALTVKTEDYESTRDLLKSKEGTQRLREGQFVAYSLDIFEAEFLLRDSYGVYPEGAEFVMDQFFGNPKVMEFWYKEGLRNWYSQDFREYVEARMPKYSGQ